MWGKVLELEKLGLCLNLGFCLGLLGCLNMKNFTSAWGCLFASGSVALEIGFYIRKCFGYRKRFT